MRLPPKPANSAGQPLGWPTDRIIVIDEDLGLSGSGFVAQSGFARLTAEVALAHVGLVLGLEVSRLARNNADWHRLIKLGGLNWTRSIKPLSRPSEGRIHFSGVLSRPIERNSILATLTLLTPRRRTEAKRE